MCQSCQLLAYYIFHRWHHRPWNQEAGVVWAGPRSISRAVRKEAIHQSITLRDSLWSMESQVTIRRKIKWVDVQQHARWFEVAVSRILTKLAWYADPFIKISHGSLRACEPSKNGLSRSAIEFERSNAHAVIASDDGAQKNTLAVLSRAWDCLRDDKNQLSAPLSSNKSSYCRACLKNTNSLFRCLYVSRPSNLVLTTETNLKEYGFFSWSRKGRWNPGGRRWSIGNDDVQRSTGHKSCCRYQNKKKVYWAHWILKHMKSSKMSNHHGSPGQSSERQREFLPSAISTHVCGPTNLTQARSILKTAVSPETSHLSYATQNLTKCVTFLLMLKRKKPSEEEHEKAVDPTTV